MKKIIALLFCATLTCATIVPLNVNAASMEPYHLHFYGTRINERTESRGTYSHSYEKGVDSHGNIVYGNCVVVRLQVTYDLQCSCNDIAGPYTDDPYEQHGECRK